MNPALELSRDRTAFVIVDVQERMMKAIPVAPRVIRTAEVLIRAGGVLGVPVFVTEQYPKGLGPTVEGLRAVLGDDKPHEKTAFSCAGCESFMTALKASGRDQIVLCGVETHICVYLSARDLVSAGHTVLVAADGCASRNKVNWRIGLNLIAQAGAVMSNSETVLFDLLKRAGGDEFKAISALVK